SVLLVPGIRHSRRARGTFSGFASLDSRSQGAPMRDLAREFRLAIRSLLRARGWTALAVLTLALGIGATTALFTVVRAVLLQALPYGNAGRLVHLWETTPTQPARQVSYPDFVDLRTQTK